MKLQIPDSPESLVLTLEQLSGKEQDPLVIAGFENFRENFFNALIDRAREHLSADVYDRADVLLDIATKIIRRGVSDNAKAKMFFIIGVTWHDFGQFEKAIVAYRQAAIAFREAGVPDGETRVQARWAQAQAANNKFRSAIRRYHKALRQANILVETDLIGQITNNLGIAYLKAGDFHRARSAFVETMFYAQSSHDDELACHARGNLGVTEFELGNYQASEGALRKAVRCARNLNNFHLEASHLGSLGNAFRAQGQLTDAEECFRNSLTIARQIGNPKYEELALGNLGIILFYSGHVNEAIANLEAACEISMSISELGNAAEDAYHLGIAYREIGDVPAAKASFKNCLELSKSVGEVTRQSGAMLSLAYFAIDEGKWDQAESYLKEAEKLDLQLADSYNTCTTPLAWGYLAYQKKDYEEAAYLWEKAHELAQQAENIFIDLTAMLNHSAALAMLRRFDEAQEMAYQALQIAQSIGLPDDERILWEELGFIFEQKQDFQRAWECYDNAIRIIETVRRTMAFDVHRIGFFSTRQSPYLRLIELLVRVGRPSEAWATSERARSRAFVDALSQTPLPVPDSLPPFLLETEGEALDRLEMLQSQIAKAQGGVLSALLNEMGYLQDRLRKILEDMQQISPEYASLRQGEPLTWQELKTLLSLTTSG